MPMKKVADWPKPKRCRHPEHKPPTMVVLEPGFYEHTCPACGEVTPVTVPPRGELRA